ncbi:MAG: hypothetical protein CME64_14600 [Halobacteriovoraceae bacterium]|nr:hypothetical protein [Halobacteriovoraceae bacterium]
MLCRILRLRIKVLFNRDMANFGVDYGERKRLTLKADYCERSELNSSLCLSKQRLISHLDSALNLNF